MTRPLLRFPIGATDQARIDPSVPVQTSEGPSTFPDSLQIQFQLDPGGAAPQIRPWSAGKLYFLPDATAPGGEPTVPASSGFDVNAWVDANHATWRTVGTLIVDAGGKTVASLMESLGIDAQLSKAQQVANRVWYWPVQIPPAFLTAGIATTLKRDLVYAGEGLPAVRTDDTLWPAHAIAGFLIGKHGVTLRTDASDPSLDEAVTVPMPEMVIDASSGFTTIFMALGVAKSPVDDGRDADVEARAATMAELNPVRTLEPLNPRIALLDPQHPSNGLLPVRWVMRNLRSLMVDANAGLPIADEVFGLPLLFWPIQFRAPGTAAEVYFSGLLAGREVTVSANGTVVQQRRLPGHGLIFVSGDDLPAPVIEGTILPPPAPLAQVRITRVGDVTGDTGTAFTLDLGGEASLTMQPMAPDPADAAAQTAYSAELAGMCHTLGRSPITMRTVRQTLADVEAPLRPTSTPATTPIFRGSLSPWGGITRSDLEQFFDGLQRIGFTAGATVGVRPAEAMVTWIMEGKSAAEGYGLLAGATFVVVSDFLLVLINIPDSEVNGASESQIRAVIRSVLCWRFWGMDIMNVGNPARDGEPIYTGTLSGSIANHNAKMDARLAEIRGFGITPPTRADVDAAVTVSRTAAGAWQYTAAANHIEVYVALQHCEYLARIAELGVNPGPGDYPTFGYAAYNGGIARALELYADAQAIIAADPDTWAGLTPEDAIGSFPLTASETLPIDPDERIPSARINGLHFGALVRSYGAVFPHVI